MIRKSRSILDELDAQIHHKDRENVIEARATHVIQSAINLITLLKENYSPEEASELERRLINSIKGQDAAKFSRGLHRIKEGRYES